MLNQTPSTRQRLDDLQRFALGISVAIPALIMVIVVTGIVPLTPVWQADYTPATVVPATHPAVGTTGYVPTVPLATVTTPGVPLTTPSLAPTAAQPARVAASPTTPTPVTSRTTPPVSPTAVIPPGIVQTQTAAELAHGTGERIALGPDGALSLAPTVSDNFGTAVLDTEQWQVVPWGAGGTAVVHDHTVSVNIAAIRTRQAFVHRTFEALARFTPGSPFQNLAWSADLNGATAILIGEPTSDPGHLYARVKQEGQADRLVVLPVALEDNAFHVYRIAWEPQQVEFAVDGVVQATLPVALDTPMFAWISAASAHSLGVKWARVLDYGETTGVFTSVPIDAGKGAQWQRLTVQGTIPAGTAVRVRTRTSVDGVTWSEDMPVGADGAVANPPRQYLQYALEVIGSATDSPTVTAVSLTVLPSEVGVRGTVEWGSKAEKCEFGRIFFVEEVVL